MDAGDRGLKGVAVTATSLEQEDQVASATTAADGSFAITGLAPGTYLVEASLGEGTLAQQWWNVEISASRPERRVDFLLDTSTDRGGISGRLDADAGNESLLSFALESPQDDMWTVWQVTPGEAGEFSIGLPPGSYLVEAATLAGGDAGRALMHWRRVEVAPGKTTPVDIPLKSENPDYAEIHGRLVTTDPGVRVQAVTARAIDDPAGNLLWQVVFLGDEPSSYRIANLPGGEYLVMVTLVWSGDEALPFYNYFRRVRLADKESLPLDFDTLAPPAIVKGRIVDESGKPVPGASLVAYPEFTDVEPSGLALADEDGRFTLYLAEGKHKLSVGVEGQPARQFDEVITVESGKTVDVGDLVLKDEGDGGDGGDGGQPGDRLVLDEDDLEQLLEEQHDGDVLSIDVPGSEVSLPGSAAELLREAGKSIVALEFDEEAVVLPLPDLDVNDLASANPDLRPWVDEPGLELRYALRPGEASAPKGFVAVGGGYELSAAAYVPQEGERALEALVLPAQLVLPVEVDRAADEPLVSLWRVGGKTPVAVPSLIVDDGTLVAAVLRPGTYVPVLRRAAFKDTKGHWAAREIAIAYSHGIISGKDAAATRFAPNDPVTRAEFAAMLARAAGLEPDPAPAARFKDVPRDIWYAGYVGAAVKAGLITGTSKTTFTPGARITRLQLAVMIGRALKAQGFELKGSPDKVLSRYRDAKNVGAWAREDLALAIQAGIVRGVNATTLGLQQNATRAQVAVMLVRYLEYVLNAGE